MVKAKQKKCTAKPLLLPIILCSYDCNWMFLSRHSAIWATKLITGCLAGGYTRNWQILGWWLGNKLRINIVLFTLKLMNTTKYINNNFFLNNFFILSLLHTVALVSTQSSQNLLAENLRLRAIVFPWTRQDPTPKAPPTEWYKGNVLYMMSSGVTENTWGIVAYAKYLKLQFNN